MRKLDESLSISDKADPSMTDGTYAQELLQETFPVRRGRNITAAIGEAFAALKKRERSLPKQVLIERERQWTERRVRSLWTKTARRVDHYEIQDLTAVAVEEARHERQRLRERDERLAALLAAHRPRPDQQVDQRQGGGAGGLDHAGDGRAFDPADDDQSRNWR